MNKFLKIWSVLTIIFMTFVVFGGALVTKTGSADGCGNSWPLCNGQLVRLTDITPEKLIEVAHRMTTGLASIFVIVLAILAWRTIKDRRETKPLAIIAVLFLILQAFMGAAAVMWGQNPYIMALHFGISIICYAAIILLALLIFEFDRKFDARNLVMGAKLRFNLYFLTIYTYLAVYTGALVRHERASLAVPVWPFQDGRFIWPDSVQDYVQYGHRLAAFILVVWILYVTWLVFRDYKHYRVLTYGMVLALILVALQALTGILSVYTGVNLYVALFHSLIITILFALFCYLCMLGARSKKNRLRIR
ncbi:COX15/CtaA family protein [Listeria fleischmannii]|jgi:cytochrome c oxidase assembly protein subunit 15|uniref:Heme A synthase n=1 Tax=Listeria fleischmannii TaxID=1069827 RepID=A0A841YDK2_9LIST|nr:heme A synthase [Listeria fleischmannii]MBC1398304.1 heme A synthase [Listeria fleischmannii]MBC1418633.1 heme A synthase [Listeria fleischmannii]MBC1426365.1 heme A synthase [Listeria fleischmannii]STY35632.1 Heme A synthase [Listeria fleischmannii subsp. coloradonensis]